MNCGKCGASETHLYRDDDNSTACYVCGHRDYNIVCDKADQEEDMKGPCRNCGREKTIVSDKLCSVCYAVAGGLSGDAKEKALTEIKRKILNGEIRTRGVKSSDEKPLKKVEIKPRDLSYDPPQEIPVTISLTIDVSVRVNGVETCRS
jgi:hypothetical protein